MRSRISARVERRAFLPRLVDHPDRGAELAGRAVAALERVALDERGLQRVQLVAAGEPLDGRQLRAVVGDGEREARVGTAPVDQDRARAALAVVAALLRAGQLEVLAEEVEQRGADVDGELVLRAR